ncbi:unnamed protein product [Protopolystoma xenopodis]|uniref:Uncharacterized protein n=1 Tax=Protopolystoma xenopodis TaxID=117903 RepID=A0A3S5AQ34_9PLAT|nr:unnamed protein product [Protopolystoma xenopodis]
MSICIKICPPRSASRLSIFTSPEIVNRAVGKMEMAMLCGRQTSFSCQRRPPSMWVRLQYHPDSVDITAHERDNVDQLHSLSLTSTSPSTSSLVV